MDNPLSSKEIARNLTELAADFGTEGRVGRTWRGSDGRKALAHHTPASKSSRPGLNRLMVGAMGKKFECPLVWKLDRFGRPLVDCLNNIKTLEDHGIRFIAVAQGLDTDLQNPASRFLLHVCKLVDAIFSFTNRNTNGIEKYFTRVDVTEEFPFLVTKMLPYYDR